MDEKKRRSFSEAYKADVVDLVRRDGRNSAKVVLSVNLTPQVVASWVRQAAVDGGCGGSDQLTTAEKAELSKLSKENKELRMEREFLKKFPRGSRARANKFRSN